MNATTVPQDIDSCSICLEVVQLRGGGVPLFCPGCCGKWFHQNCAENYIKSSPTSTQDGKICVKCPSCRSYFPVPNHMLPTVPVLPQFIRPPTPPRTHQEELLEPMQSTALEPMQIESVVESQDPREPINIILTPERQYLSLAGISNFNVRVGLRYDHILADSHFAKNDSVPPAATKSDGLLRRIINSVFDPAPSIPLSQAGVDVVCVLDTSGSMTGTKLDSLKHAMSFVIDVLGPNDRLAVVSFNSAFKLEHSLLKMSNSNKQAAKGIQQNLRAGGGTSIFNGMNEGARILRQRRTFNGASCMFLLTDGQDSSDKERKEALATEMRNAGTALFVFGFGADHDAKEMSSLAESAEGSFIYVETDDAVVDAFGGAIGSMQGNSLATKLTLRVQAATPGVLIDSVRGGRYAFSINAEKDLAKVSIANMFHGEKKDFLFQLTVPAVVAPCPTPLLSASLEYTLRGQTFSFPVIATSSSSAANAHHCVVTRVDDEDSRLRDQSTHREVDEQINRLATATAIAAATEAADKGDFEQAQRIIAAAVAALKSSSSFLAGSNISEGLLGELQEAADAVSSRSSYSFGGKGTLHTSTISALQQRSHYTKVGKANHYQSPSSMSYQTSAATTKKY